ncbi:hypothetical protein [Actinomadura rudentiformis]|uniref:Uncharacterized protein n=1 Tax=Actinomadura rudentiformis TaxID=359158 RepID=A0A6H9YWW1_9ACTN|nr:hypothetical protein [Actinomadura rudentiformis]KAB2348481.1 hypothetical protein F8566_17000 [Actinomadura rudentiformis]
MTAREVRRIPVAVPPPISWGARWRARRNLTKLARALHGDGWTTVRKYEENPPRLRVFLAEVPCVGETVTVIQGWSKWGFVTSAGLWVGPCREPEYAAGEVAHLLKPWVKAAPIPREVAPFPRIWSR